MSCAVQYSTAQYLNYKSEVVHSRTVIHLTRFTVSVLPNATRELDTVHTAHVRRLVLQCLVAPVPVDPQLCPHVAENALAGMTVDRRGLER